MATATLTIGLGTEWHAATASTLDTSTSLAASSDEVRVLFGGVLTRQQAIEGLDRLRLKAIQSVSWPVA